MNKKTTISVILCLLVIFVWYSQRSNSLKPSSSGGSTSVSPDASPGGTLKQVASKRHSRQLQNRQALALLRSARKLAAHSKDAIEDELSEEEQIAAENNVPEQIAWRNAWIDESQDDEWTKRMEREMNEKASALLVGQIDIRHLSCRETVCRMYLQFEDKLDAETFTFSKHDPALHYEYQLLNPDPEGADEESILDKEKKYNYEVLVKRDRPANLPESIRSTPPPSHGTVYASRE
jgi:hypothetical protein